MKNRVRVSTIVIHNDQILTFFAVDPTNGKEYYFLPGGEIEPEETAPEAAIRETFEETGYSVTIDVKSNVDKDYFFHWNGEDYNVLTIFYRAYLSAPFQSPKPIQDAPYHKGVHWKSVKDIPTLFAYSTEIRDAILEVIAQS